MELDIMIGLERAARLALRVAALTAAISVVGGCGSDDSSASPAARASGGAQLAEAAHPGNGQGRWPSWSFVVWVADERAQGARRPREPDVHRLRVRPRGRHCWRTLSGA